MLKRGLFAIVYGVQQLNACIVSILIYSNIKILNITIIQKPFSVAKIVSKIISQNTHKY